MSASSASPIVQSISHIFQRTHSPEMNNAYFYKLALPDDENNIFYSFSIGMLSLIAHEKYLMPRDKYLQLQQIFKSPQLNEGLRQISSFHDTGYPSGPGKKYRVQGLGPYLTRIRLAVQQGLLDSPEQFRTFLLSVEHNFESQYANFIFFAEALQLLGHQLHRIKNSNAWQTVNWPNYLPNNSRLVCALALDLNLGAKVYDKDYQPLFDTNTTDPLIPCIHIALVNQKVADIQDATLALALPPPHFHVLIPQQDYILKPSFFPREMPRRLTIYSSQSIAEMDAAEEQQAKKTRSGMFQIRNSQPLNQEPFLHLNLPQDGLNLFYGLSMGFINLLMTKQLSLSEPQYALLLQHFKNIKHKDKLNKLLTFHETKSITLTNTYRVKGLQPFFDQFKDALERGQLENAGQFLFYLQEADSSFENFYANLIIVALALRTTAAQLSSSRNELELAYALASYYHFEINLYDDKALEEVAAATEVENQKGCIHLVHFNNHTDDKQSKAIRPPRFNFLISEADYLAQPHYFAIESRRPLDSVLHPTEMEASQLRAHFDWERHHQYRHHLRLLESAINTLNDEDEQCTGIKLLSTLRDKAHLLFESTSKSEERLQAFIESYAALEEAQLFYADNNALGLNTVLANLGLCILGLGLGYLLAASYHYYSTGRFTFFSQPALNWELAIFSNQLLALSQDTGLLAKAEKIAPLEASPAWSSLRL